MYLFTLSELAFLLVTLFLIGFEVSYVIMEYCYGNLIKCASESLEGWKKAHDSLMEMHKINQQFITDFETYQRVITVENDSLKFEAKNRLN